MLLDRLVAWGHVPGKEVEASWMDECDAEEVLFLRAKLTQSFVSHKAVSERGHRLSNGRAQIWPSSSTMIPESPKAPGSATRNRNPYDDKCQAAGEKAWPGVSRTQLRPSTPSINHVAKDLSLFGAKSHRKAETVITSCFVNGTSNTVSLIFDLYKQDWYTDPPTLLPYALVLRYPGPGRMITASVINLALFSDEVMYSFPFLAFRPKRICSVRDPPLSLCITRLLRGRPSLLHCVMPTWLANRSQFTQAIRRKPGSSRLPPGPGTTAPRCCATAVLSQMAPEVDSSDYYLIVFWAKRIRRPAPRHVGKMVLALVATSCLVDVTR